MNPGAKLQRELKRAIETLRRRHANTGDPEERNVLVHTIQHLDERLTAFTPSDTLSTADALADSVESLVGAVASVRHGPFDGYLAALERHLATLSNLSGALHGAQALPSAAAGDGREPAAAPAKITNEETVASPRTAPETTHQGAAGLAAPAVATDYATLKDEYSAWYAACRFRPERQAELAYYLKRLDQGQTIYQQVGAELNIPWIFIGITHGMECGFNFGAHLHNGDPLNARTVRVPKGRPLTGEPPFTWSQSARDALIYKGYHQISDWSVPHMLYLFERYNGMGYRRRNVPSPYLWSYSNLYERGKFVVDGRFDPDAVSKQCGAALMLKAVLG